MAVSQESLSVEVVLDASGAIKGLKDLNGTFISVGTSVGETDKQMSEFEKALESMAVVAKKGGKDASTAFDKISGALTRAFVPVTALNQGFQLLGQAIGGIDRVIGTTVRSFIQLESSVARINTLIPEAERGMYDFAEAIREQQSAFGTDVATAGKAYYEAIASGAVDAAGAITLMDTAQKLAIGGVTSLDTAVNALTTVISSYGIAAEDASKISDILFIAAAGGKTDIEQLAKQMGDVVGIAKAAGVSFGEVASAVSAVTAAGQPTAIAVTGVRAAISELLTPTKELQFALKNLGIENVEAAIAQKGFVGVLREVADAYGGNATALAALFARIESLAALTALVSDRVGAQFDDMNQASKDAMNGVASNTENAFGVMALTVEQRMNQARGTISAEMSRIGKIFVDGFGPSTAGASEAIAEIIALIRELARIAIPILGAIASAINTLLVQPLAMAVKGWREIINLAFEAEAAFKGLFSSSEAAAKAAASATESASKSAAPSADMPSINQQAVREAVAGLEKLREQTKGLEEATRMVGKTQQEQARIERAFRLQQIEDTEKQLKSMGLLGGLNQKTLEDARKGINAYYDAMEKQGALEDLKKKTEEQKRALEEQMRAIEGVGRAYLALSASVQKLSDVYELMQFDSVQLSSTPIGQQVDIAERAYQIALRQIEAEKQKAIAAGVSLKAVDEQVSKAVALAQEIRGQTDALEVQKSVRDAMKAAEASAQTALDAAYSQALSANEELLRVGMSRTEIIERELQVELDKIDAIEEQLRKTRELNSADVAALRIARDTAKAKAEAAKMPAPGSAESAPGIGAAVPAVAAVGAGPVGAFMAAAEMIVGVVQKLIDFIPNILNAIGKIFSSLSDLPNMILKAVGNVISSLVKFTSEFIPNLFKAIPEIIDQILTAAFETLPDAAQKLIESLPSLIEGLLDRIPDLVAKLVDGLVSNSATISIGIIRALIENLPAFFKAIALFIPRLFLAIAKGIIKGIIDGIKNIWAALKGGTKNVGQSIASGFTDGLKKLTGFKGNLFGITEDVLSGPVEQVKSLVAEAEKAGRSIWEALKAAIKQAWEWIKGIGKQIWEGLKEQTLASWEWLKSVGKAIWEGTVNAAKEAWEFIKTIGKTIWDGMVSAVSGAWEFVKSIGATLWQGVVNSVSTIWEALETAGGKIWEGLKLLFSGKGSEAWEKFKEAGGAIWEGMKALWNQGWSTLKNLGQAIWDAFKNAWESGGSMFSKVGTAIWDAFKSAFGGLKDLMAKLDIGSLIGKLFKDPNPGKEKIEGWLGVDIPFLKFSQGGLVPGRPVVMGDSQRNDTVPALVSPGEAIIPRSLMQDPAVAKLIDGILGGQRPRGFSNGLRRLASSAGSAIKSGAQAVGGAVTSAIDKARSAFSGLSDGAKATWSFIQSLGKKVDLVEFIKNPLKYATDIFKSAIDPFFKGRLDTIMGGIFKANAFATGGMVGGTGYGDTVPAMLTPGEFVMKRSAVDSIGSGVLAQMNRTGQAPQMQAGDVNVTLNIKTEQPIDEGFVRRTLVPTVKDEMRKASLRGEFILSARGVRA